MRSEQQITNLATGVTLGRQVAQDKKVAERLAHLFAFNEQVRAVHPMFDEAFSGRLQAGALALGDFVLVMWEDEVFAAEMQVETGSEQFHAHGAALDVPAGATIAPRAGPEDRTV